MDLLQHFGHEHPLVFIQEQSHTSDEAHCSGSNEPVDQGNCNSTKEACFYCSGCEERVEGPSYCCTDCKFYLHKTCAELAPEINHPLHRKHPLSLLAGSPYPLPPICNFCRSPCKGFVYHCSFREFYHFSFCEFYLHVKCASLPQFGAGNIPELEHFGHKHPFIFIEEHKNEVKDSCSWCEESLSGPIYSCFDCGFHLDKKCFELPLQIIHPFHREHHLLIVDKPPNPTKDTCNFCRCPFWGSLYHCSSCGFNLHIKCALLAWLDLENVVEIQHFSHEAHPLIFIENCNLEVNDSCFGCRKSLSGPIYSCVDCRFHLHKNCAELPVEIKHSSHRKHPLFLLENLPTHEEGCSCYLCKKQKDIKGFVYYCSHCKYGVMPEDVSLSRTARPEDHNHEHPLTLVSRPISFICDFCGTDRYGTPYLCSTCDLLVEKDCFSFPSIIRITRHPHEISHVYFLQENDKFEKRECSICHKNVNTEHGSYYCHGCNYIVHVHCATDEFIWDRTTDLDDEDRASLITLVIVIETIRVGEDLIASKISHSFDPHSLSLTLTLTPNGGSNQDSKSCDGCMQPISAPFYSCGECDFYLHRNCAELPMKKRLPLHRHPLTISAPYMSECSACLRFHNGFSYGCKKCDFYVDIQCSSLSDTLKHESHEHQLFLDHKYEGNCSGCQAHIAFRTGAFRCSRYCDFVLDFKCITLPLKAWYKYDRHDLSLTYTDVSDPNQHYCDLCEEERNPKHWFYYCKDCDNSVHPECILGELPHVKLGRRNTFPAHPDPLFFKKKIWDLPLCKVCGTLCKVQFLECRQPGCDFTTHWRCAGDPVMWKVGTM